MKALLIPATLICLTVQAQEPPQLRWHGTSNGWMPWSGQDKALHFGVGQWAGIVIYSLYHNEFKLQHPWLWTVLSVSFIGWAKEHYDRLNHGDPEYADWLMTTEGGALGGFVLHIGLDYGHHTVEVTGK